MALAVLEALLVTRQRGADPCRRAHRAALRRWSTARWRCTRPAGRCICWSARSRRVPRATSSNATGCTVLAKAVPPLRTRQPAVGGPPAHRQPSAGQRADAGRRGRPDSASPPKFPAIVHELDEGLTWIALPARQAGAALASHRPCTPACWPASHRRCRPCAAPARHRPSAPRPAAARPADPRAQTVRRRRTVAAPEWALLAVRRQRRYRPARRQGDARYVAHLAPAGRSR